ncbi:SDR family NAD(P)-dependent oxidoreductase [Oceanobacillus manasiensis]|uniref:SDR family NAD(P)-dependent oxidoreductase n=1 Tax=Oceanobacillus manasiensis TaxID=586413 RepID=UPI000694C2C9|nr:SDR family NAD(P)-dependent oxidoreductase [Oceanobacillus manasiensis]
MSTELKKYILSQVAKQALPKEEAKKYLQELTAQEQSAETDVAIIGIAGRFAETTDPESFWQLLREGKNSIRKFPKDRFKDAEDVLRNPHLSEFVFGNSIRPEDVPFALAESGYLIEVDKFDAPFFGISPIEATHMDPQHRLVLEVAYEAMEDAGYGGQSLYGSRTGAYIGKEGTNNTFYSQRSVQNPMQLTGSWESLMASRISYLFDFKSPCMVVDTACSSGLVSVHVAAQALIAGDCDVAIAGGINLALNGDIKPEYQKGASMGDVQAQDDKVRPFDAKATGTLWGEGVGMVILKPLHKAIEDRDQIRAIIKGSSINNDGASKSITSPNAEMQEEVIVDAWKKAGIAPETISYIEAHGTGTVLGDPIEVKALHNAFRRFTSEKQFCAIGSLKTNMGHLVGASGTTALIKVIKSLEHKEVAPMLNFESPNPYINFIESPLYINDRLQPWDSGDKPRRAAISSFGFSRTNCHMIVEEPPVVKIKEAKQPRYCLTISAKNEKVMKNYMKRYAQFLQKDAWTLADLCYTSNIGRGHYEHRVVLIAESKEKLRSLMQELVNHEGNPSDINGIYSGQFRIANENKKDLEQGEMKKHDLMKMNKTANAKLKEYVDGNAENPQLLMEVCSFYSQGADVDWKLFYREEKRSRIQAPVYPLEKIRFWAKPKVKVEQFKQREKLHPLVEKKISHSNEEICYETVFHVDKHWVLNDHRIGDKAVLPGTSYLEMVRFAATEVFGKTALEFRDVFFLSPLVIDDHTESLVRLIFVKLSSGFSFIVKGKNPAGGWVPYVEGRISILEKSKADDQQKRDLSSLKSNADTVIDAYKEKNVSEVFTFGPHWETVTAVWSSERETLGKLELQEEYQHELSDFQLHPSMLDNAVNLISQKKGKVFLPFNYKGLKLYAPMAKEVYTHIRQLNNIDGSEGITTYDIDLLDKEGRLLAQINDYTVKQVKDISALGKSVMEYGSYQMKWVPRDSNNSNENSVHGDWALVSTPGLRSRELEEALIASGLNVTTYHLGTSNHSDLMYFPDKHGFDAILTDAEKRGVQGILFASDYTIEEEEKGQLLTSQQVFQKRRTLGVDALFHLGKQLLNRNMKQINNLKVLTSDGWMVDGNESSINPLSGSTAALAKVIGQEYRHLKVDITDAAEDVPISDVINECLCEDRIRALRQSGVYVEELKPYEVLPTNGFTPDSGGAYVISGGLGGVGMSIAEHLAKTRDIQVVLLGRRSLAPESEWEERANSGSAKSKEMYIRLINLKSQMKTLEYISIDVSNTSDVETMAQDLKKRYGHINGIFHAAGLPGDGFLMLKEENKFKEVLNPKLDGSMNLLRILPKNNKSFLSLFSSVSSLAGGEGQGDYTAANAFLDSLADMGQLEGLKVSAVNWPGWKSLGMTLFHEQQKKEGMFKSVNLEGVTAVSAMAFDDVSIFKDISIENGMKWLEESITNPQRRIIPSPLNITLAVKLQEGLPFRLDSRLIQNVSSSEKPASDHTSESSQEVNVKIKGTMEPTETQVIIGNAFGHILGLDEIDIYTSFQDMGGNSLMTTQLLKLIDKHIPGQVDISDLFSYPSVKDLSDYIDEKNGISKEKQTSSQTDNEDNELIDLIEQELEGTEYLDEFLVHLKGGGKDGQ